MTRSLGSDAGLANTLSAKSTNHPTRRIVFIASRQAVYQCLFQTAQRYFSTFELSYLDQIPATPQDDVGLVLIGHGPEWSQIEHLGDCRKHFPGASLGLMVEASTNAVDSTLLDQRLVQGVIPLSLPLDVWLAVISLLAFGGEYILPGVARAQSSGKADHYRENSPAARVLPHGQGYAQRHAGVTHHFGDAGGQNDGGEDASDLEALTTREREILQLVSQGLQNKIIADRMALSENTVKAHVHNLIAKLRVSNRTQAAAFLHGRQATRGVYADGRMPARPAIPPGR